jgi:methenyltetrahydrofolate cyclohydrolase
VLDRLAAATPAPGAGSASAVACGLAAGLVEMAAGFDGDSLGDVGERAKQLRTRALELAEVELSAYEPVLAALRLPQADPQRSQRIAQARAEASQPPIEIAAIGAELAELAARTARACSRHLVGDVVAGAVLAEAACRAAARLVELNLSGVDDWRGQRAGELAREAAASREQALRDGER